MPEWCLKGLGLASPRDARLAEGASVSRICLPWCVSPVHAEGGVDVSMLRAAVSRIDGAVETEASGNVTLSTVKAIASTGCSYISVGALTHSVTALDISLKIKL